MGGIRSQEQKHLTRRQLLRFRVCISSGHDHVIPSVSLCYVSEKHSFLDIRMATGSDSLCLSHYTLPLDSLKKNSLQCCSLYPKMHCIEPICVHVCMLSVNFIGIPLYLQAFTFFKNALSHASLNLKQSICGLAKACLKSVPKVKHSIGPVRQLSGNWS